MAATVVKDLIRKNSIVVVEDPVQYLFMVDGRIGANSVAVKPHVAQVFEDLNTDIERVRTRNPAIMAKPVTADRTTVENVITTLNAQWMVTGVFGLRGALARTVTAAGRMLWRDEHVNVHVQNLNLTDLLVLKVLLGRHEIAHHVLIVIRLKQQQFQRRCQARKLFQIKRKRKLQKQKRPLPVKTARRLLLRTSPVQKTDTIQRCITRYHKPRDQQPANYLYFLFFFYFFFLLIHIVSDLFSLFSLHTENRLSIDVCLLSDYKYGRQRHQQIQLL